MQTSHPLPSEGSGRLSGLRVYCAQDAHIKKKKMHVSGQNFSSADMKNDHGKFLLSIVYFLFCALTT